MLIEKQDRKAPATDPLRRSQPFDPPPWHSHKLAPPLAARFGCLLFEFGRFLRELLSVHVVFAAQGFQVGEGILLAHAVFRLSWASNRRVVSHSSTLPSRPST